MMKSQSLLSVVILASALPSAFAWGSLGHATVAYIASNFGMLILEKEEMKMTKFWE